MTLTRSAFYWLWFLLFGVTSALGTFLPTHHLGTEEFWLLGVSLAALLVGSKTLAPTWAKPFDTTVGIIFFAVGVVGILHVFGVDLVNTSSVLPDVLFAPTKFLGLSLDLDPAVLHTALGFLALRIALKSASQTSSLEVSTSPK